MASDSEGVEESDGTYFIVDSIVGVDLIDGDIKYRVRWQNYQAGDDTYEPESHFRYESVLSKMMDDFQTKNMTRIQELREMAKVARKKKKVIRRSVRKTYEYVDESKEENGLMVSREPLANDEFYGTTVADATGELKRLIDPSHKNSSTELILAQMNSNARVTRRQMKNMLPEVVKPDSGQNSASPTPPLLGSKRQSAGKETEVSIGAKRCLNQNMSDVFDAEDDNDEIKTDDTTTSSEEIFEVFSLIRNSGASDTTSETVVLDNVEADETAFEKKTNAQAVKSSSERVKREKDKSSTKAERAVHLEKCIEASPKVETSNEIKEGSRNNDFQISSWDNISANCTDETSCSQVAVRYSLSPLELNTIIREGDIKLFKKTIHLAKCDKDFYRWTDRDTGFTFFHTLCAYVKCPENHETDDFLTYLCDSSVFGQIIDYQEKSNLFTALHYSVENGATCRVSRLLAFNCAVNYPDRNGYTPLRLAYRKNHAKMMKLLLQKGANFAQLELEEKRKAPEERKKRAYEVLTRHVDTVRNLLSTTRNRVFRNLVDACESTFQSPIMTSPCHEGPTFIFPYNLPAIEIPNETYMFLLFIYMCNFESNDFSKWTARCWPELHVRCEVNNCALEPVQNSTHPMVFFANSFKTGDNILKIEFTNPDVVINFVLAAQVVLVKRTEEILQYAATPWSINSGLEVAPLVGPMF